MSVNSTRILVLAGAFLCLAASGVAQNRYVLPADFLNSTHPRVLALPAVSHPGAAPQSDRDGLSGIDSVINWTGSFLFKEPGFIGPPRTWLYDVVGNPPEMGGTTTINAPVIPVAMDLLNADGSVLFHYSPRSIVSPTMLSPMFQNATFTSSPTPTQVNDAIQRAGFWGTMAPDWHTMLNGSLKRQRTIAVPAGFYYYAPRPNGACCLYVLVDGTEFGTLMFPASPDDVTTPIGNAEHSGDITTQDISTFLFRDTYLYYGDPNNCCVLGYHTYDSKPGDAKNGYREKRYVLNYSSWVTPGLFDVRWIDVTALGHELAESFNDPFVVSDGLHNLTPWWLAPNGVCSDVVEVGDVVENLANAAFPVKLNGRTYHPQSVALLPWFEFQSPSTAIDGAYSYPDETAVPALSPFVGPGCIGH